jgi:BirA family biotin operon repressor/biotin-[acetyl-CoA-carboxylase] ligase
VTIEWDGHTAAALAHRCGVPRLELLSEVDSTQDLAHDLADRGAPSGTVVLADSQRSGRGRLGRAWTSLPGRGIWCTVIERPSDPVALDVLSIRVGLRAAEALDAFANAPVVLKWPNDLMLPDGKLGGILAEARWTGASLGWVAIGLGVNVQRPPGVADAAGLKDGTRRVDVLAAVVPALRAAASCVGHLSGEEMARYRTRDALAGRFVVSPGRGKVSGIAPNGSLVIDTSAGPTQFRSGTVAYAEQGEGET